MNAVSKDKTDEVDQLEVTMIVGFELNLLGELTDDEIAKVEKLDAHLTEAIAGVLRAAGVVVQIDYSVSEYELTGSNRMTVH